MSIRHHRQCRIVRTVGRVLSDPAPPSTIPAVLIRLTSVALVAGPIWLAGTPAAAQKPTGPRLQLEFLDRLADQAEEVVDVTVDPAMLQTAAGLAAGGKGPDAATLKTLLEGIKGIYVKSFEFTREGAYTEADVERVRTQLKEPWARTISVKSRKERELVEVYVWREGADPEGLAVIVAEPKELTIVNVVGRLDMKILGALQGQFGIPGGLGALGAAPGSSKQSGKSP
jgi:hypothetical protein